MDGQEELASAGSESKSPNDIPAIYDRNANQIYPMRPLTYYGVQIGRLGEGSYAEVLGYRSEVGEVAVKRYKSKDTVEGLSHDALIEISVLKRCRHPNIIKMIDITQFSVKMYPVEIDVVLEKGGTSLGKYLFNGVGAYSKRFTPGLCKSLMYQIIRGIYYLHLNDIVHRDLKPDNILMFPDGTIRIADFGLAKTGVTPCSSSSEKVQTLWWRAPELLLGAESQGKQIDVFSLGIVFIEIWTGHILLPFQLERDVLYRQIAIFGNMTEDEWPGISGFRGYDAGIAQYAAARHTGRFREEFVQKRAPYLNELESQGGLELIRRMAWPNPSLRMTIEQALNHPYFKNDQEGIIEFIDKMMPVENNDKFRQLFGQNPIAPYCGENLSLSLLSISPEPEEISPFTLQKVYSLEEFRRILDWVGSMSIKYSVLDESLFHFSYLMQYYLSKMPSYDFNADPDIIPLIKANREALTNACLLISSKIYDDLTISMGVLIFESQNSLTEYQIRKAELSILKALNFDLLFPTPNQFLVYALKGSPDNLCNTSHALAKLLLLLALPELNAEMLAYLAVYIVFQCSDTPYPVCLERYKKELLPLADKAIANIESITDYNDNVYSLKLQARPDIRAILENWSACRTKKQNVFGF